MQRSTRPQHYWRRFQTLLAVIAVGPLFAFAPRPTTAEDGDVQHMFVGTYTSGKSEGIYRVAFDMTTGEMGQPQLAAKTPNPSFLEIAPNGKHLYAVNELTKYQGDDSGAITAYALNPASGELGEINQQATQGGAPCHLVIDATGKFALVANYVGGNVASFPINSDGSLKPAASVQQHKGASVNPNRQKAPHAHSINLDADNQFAVAADLGTDELLVYLFDANSGRLTPQSAATAKAKPGAGPRHFVFHPSGRFAYAINELDLTVRGYAYGAGKLSAIQSITTLPEGVEDRKGMSTAEVRVSPNGKYLFGSNRGHNTIAAYRIDGATGKLTALGHTPTGGRTPRNFNVTPNGRFVVVANQSTSNLVAFRLDNETGRLTPTGQSVYVPNPVCIRFARKLD